MKITLAKTAGFCFGVNRAVQMVYDLLEKGESVFTLGPIIHNPQLVEELRQRGVRIVENPEEVSDGGILVIRSHGVAQSVLEDAEKRGIRIADATCPFVSKIHGIVSEKSRDGYTVIIAGDQPSVAALAGYVQVEVLDPGDTRRGVFDLEESRVVAIGQLYGIYEILLAADDELIQRGSAVRVGIPRDDPPRVLVVVRLAHGRVDDGGDLQRCLKGIGLVYIFPVDTFDCHFVDVVIVVVALVAVTGRQKQGCRTADGCNLV